MLDLLYTNVFLLFFDRVALPLIAIGCKHWRSDSILLRYFSSVA